MENIEKALNLLSQINHTNSSQVIEAADVVLPLARKEFEALKASGVEVKIEHVEKVTVLSGGRPRTQRRTRKKPVSQIETR